MEVWWFPANSIGKDLGTIIQVKRSPSVFVRSNMVQHYPNPPGHQLSWPYRWVDTISSMFVFSLTIPKSKWFWFQISLNVFTLNFGEDDPFFGSNSFTIFDVFWVPESHPRFFVNRGFSWMTNQFITWKMVGNHQTSIHSKDSLEVQDT